MAVTQQAVLDALHHILDPDTRRDIVSLNLVKTVNVEGGTVSLEIPGTASGSALPPLLEAEIKKAVILLPGVKQVLVNPGRASKPAPNPQSLVKHVRHIIAVASAKGGVGKSTVSVNLAAALAATGARVGLLDADIYGPNVPLMAGAEGAEPTVAVYSDKDGNTTELIEPVEANGLKVMSMGFLVHPGQAVMWRGPMLNSALRQFLGQVDWGELDYLVIDLPPGTGDVQLSLLQMVPVSGIIHVTTPQEVALQDVRRGVAMFENQRVPVIGLIENMSFFICPHCHEKSEIFSTGGGHRIGEELGVPLIAQIPLNIRIREAGDAGKPIALNSQEPEIADLFKSAVNKIVARLDEIGSAHVPVSPLGQGNASR